jgi:steroid delta-isomerase-like uncharacterized protein
MAEHPNARLLRAHYDAFNSRSFDKSFPNLANDVEWNNVAFKIPFKGHQGYKQFLEGWVSAFPDGKCEVKNIVGNDDFLIAEGVFSGTHKGTLKMPTGEHPATNRRQETPFCEVVMMRNGKIVKSNVYFDALTMLRQLGIEPARKAA